MVIGRDRCRAAQVDGGEGGAFLRAAKGRGTIMPFRDVEMVNPRDGIWSCCDNSVRNVASVLIRVK